MTYLSMKGQCFQPVDASVVGVANAHSSRAMHRCVNGSPQLGRLLQHPRLRAAAGVARRPGVQVEVATAVKAKLTRPSVQAETDKMCHDGFVTLRAVDGRQPGFAG